MPLQTTRCLGSQLVTVALASALALALALPGVVVVEAAEFLSPQEALESFEVEPGFAVDLVAAEPLTVDPVALAFDEQGRLYVAENRDYPVGGPDGKPMGRIALLEDTNGDGVMDRRSDFVTGIGFPNGVMCWKGGVIVTAAPDVWWLKDSDGDGVADVKERWLTGFALGGSSQLRVNDPTLGPDGWVYLAGGLSGGKVSAVAHPEAAVELSKGDVRFHPESWQLVMVEGKSQFGLAFDDAGNRFACMNRVQVQYAPLPSHYLARNAQVASPGVLHACPELQENRLLVRYSGPAARIFPISANVTTADSHAGTYSAACAVHVYRGNQLPPDYEGAAFSCDPTGNLVRGDKLEKAGGTFAVRRIHEGTEAMRSRDNWFRPVFLADGPDGALYVADMYRKTIEHPEYLPEALRKHTDFVSGRDQGRIWRLRSASAKPTVEPNGSAIQNRSWPELARLLDHPVPWYRDLAWRWMMEGRSQKDWVESLKKVSVSELGWRGQIRVLEALSQTRNLNPELLLPALGNKQPEVRAQAVRWSETLVASHEEIRKAVLGLVNDADPQVRYRVALALGNLEGEEAIRGLVSLARVQGWDKWTRAAIQTSLPGWERARRFLYGLISDGKHPGEGVAILVEDVARQVGALQSDRKDASILGDLLSRSAESGAEVQSALVLGYAAGNRDGFASVAASMNAELRSTWDRALKLAVDENAGLISRVKAVQMLGINEEGSDRVVTVLEGLLNSRVPMELQTAAVKALVQWPKMGRSAGWLKGDRWKAYSPGLRATWVGAMLARPEWVGLVLEMIERGEWMPHSLTTAQREQLKQSKDGGIRDRARKLFTVGAGDRREAFEVSRAALGLKPDAAHGQEVFTKHCSGCHRFNREGFAVGPDLFDIRNQPKETILMHIILPEYEIAPQFTSFEVETKDGRQWFGLVAGESGGVVTLRQAQGVEDRIERDRIVRMEASRLSLMPQELEKVIPVQELADLLAYLKGEQ